jgi:hypothetical protein
VPGNGPQAVAAVAVSCISRSAYSFQRRSRQPRRTWFFRPPNISIRPQTLLRSRRQGQDCSLWSREADKRRAHCRFPPPAKSRYLAVLRNFLQGWLISPLFARLRSCEYVGSDRGACSPERWNLRSLPCPVFRSRRRLIPLARKQPAVGRPRKAITAKRSPLVAQRCIAPAIHPSRQSSAKIPTPTAPRSRAAHHRRKPTRRHGTPCLSCGSPTARSPWPSAYRHGQRSPSWTPSRQRRRIPSRKS